MQAVDLPDGSGCELTMVTWGEMCDSFDPWWVNLFNTKFFVVPKFQRFRKIMAEGEESALTVDDMTTGDIAKSCMALQRHLPKGFRVDLSGRGGSDFEAHTRELNAKRAAKSTLAGRA